MDATHNHSVLYSEYTFSLNSYGTWGCRNFFGAIALSRIGRALRNMLVKMIQYRFDFDERDLDALTSGLRGQIN